MKTFVRRILRRIKKVGKQKPDLSGFKKEFDLFNSLDVGKKLSNHWEDISPWLNDKIEATPFDAHYVFHPAWAARIVKKINPVKHVDVSSTVNFCTILSAFIPTEYYEYRPVHLNLSSLLSEKADLNNLFFETGSIECISCMHTIEHIGLGRYGDKIEPDADLKAIAELQRVVKRGGTLLLVVPVGKPRIQYNAHRVYSFQLINDLFKDFDLKDFSLIDDAGNYLESVDSNLVQEMVYGCGCFWYVKK